MEKWFDSAPAAQTWYPWRDQWLPERPLEPPDTNTAAPEAVPSCQCAQCGQGIWPGESTFDGGDGPLCRECFGDVLRDMMERHLEEIAELLGYDVRLQE